MGENLQRKIAFRSPLRPRLSKALRCPTSWSYQYILRSLQTNFANNIRSPLLVYYAKGIIDGIGSLAYQEATAHRKLNNCLKGKPNSYNNQGAAVAGRVASYLQGATLRQQ